MTTLPDNHQVTVTMTGKQMRALIDIADLTNDNPLNGMTPAASAVLYLMAALQQAETLHAAEVSA